MSYAPIYLLQDGEAKGPYDVDEIEALIGDEALAPETLASIEGMPKWRCVEETVVWAKATELKPARGEIMRLVEEMLALQKDLKTARAELRALVKQFTQDNLGDCLGTILDVNEGLLRNWRLCDSGQDKWTRDCGEFWPALELVAFRKLQFPRDWQADWVAAGGKVFDGHMVARKDDSVWRRLSDFGFPFPPFSLDRAMWVEDVSRDEARDFGIALGGPFEMPKPGRPFELGGIL